jgi:hypothetical protein
VKQFIKKKILRRRAGTPTFYREIISSLRGALALEIGGPSQIFSPADHIPIYSTIRKLDLCNFSDKTIWDEETSNYNMNSLGLHDKTGNLIVSEAVDVDIKNGH